jgi:hypothetical protein
VPAEPDRDADIVLSDAALMIEQLRAKNEKLRRSLERIANPISALQARAKAEGCLLNGAMAVSLSNDAGYLKDIARSALEALNND